MHGGRLALRHPFGHRPDTDQFPKNLGNFRGCHKIASSAELIDLIFGIWFSGIIPMVGSRQALLHVILERYRAFGLDVSYGKCCRRPTLMTSAMVRAKGVDHGRAVDAALAFRNDCATFQADLILNLVDRMTPVRPPFVISGFHQMHSRCPHPWYFI